MRQIKFRWFIRGVMEYEFDGWREDVGINEMFMYIKDSEYPTMQYTGLSDKNGKEIYEGDAVATTFGNYVCEFPFTLLYEAAQEDGIGEILGNIYENPELIR